MLRVLLLLLSTLVLYSCQEQVIAPKRKLILDDYHRYRTSDFALNSHKIRNHIALLMELDKDSMLPDNQARKYYREKKSFLWVDRRGADNRIDTLLNALRTVTEVGFSADKFHVHQLSDDVDRLRNLAFDSVDNEINKVVARIEYQLTKAYFRYAMGQRFGFVNPRRLLNKIDVRDSDSVSVVYRQLYDIHQDTPGSKFFKTAVLMAGSDSLTFFLKQIQPRGLLYQAYLGLLAKHPSGPFRVKVLCNLERSRWRLYDSPERHRKYVLVNLPSFHLDAVDGDEEMQMRIGCGTFQTKTPLLTSSFSRMDLNPQWVIPMSIIKKDIVAHAGDSSYFTKRRFFVVDRNSGKRVPLSRVTSSMLQSTRYYVAQEGGEGNSLGRIIFRFDNKFAVYLHDTSNRGVFGRGDRGVSHGCVRVEKPFELALFMLEKEDEDMASKIRYTMSVPVGAKTHDTENVTEQPEIDSHRLLRSVKIVPGVPLFITYYTLYPSKNGQMQEFTDIYGYDRLLYKELQNYGVK